MIGMMFEKMGMTSVFNEEEKMIPVTVLRALSSRVLGLTSEEEQGYVALRVAYGLNKKEKRKSVKGIFGSLPVAKGVKEFRLNSKEMDEFKGIPRGASISLSSFNEVSYVDARAKSVGRGYQGVVKRHGMSGGPKTHGSHFHRKPGSIGMCADPARVFKGRALPGQMGDVMVCVQNLKVFRVLEEEGVLLLTGSVPGRNGALVQVTPSVKKRLEMKVVVDESGEREKSPQKDAPQKDVPVGSVAGQSGVNPVVETNGSEMAGDTKKG